MWVESPLIDPSMAHTFSSYTILTISLLEAPHVAASLWIFSRNGFPQYPPRALASSIASCAPCSMASPNAMSLCSSDRPQKADRHLVDIRRRNGRRIRSRPVILRRLRIVLVVGLAEFGEWPQIFRSSGVGRQLAGLRRTLRLGPAGTGRRLRAKKRRSRERRRNQLPSHSSYLRGVTNIAIASISTSSSGRQSIAWMPVEAGSGSSPCSRRMRCALR